MVQKFELGSDAITYIRSSLPRRGKALSQSLLELPFEDGQVVTYLPADSDPYARTNFEVGGITKKSQTEPKLVEFIQQYLKGGSDRYLVLENALAQPNDSWLEKRNLQFFSYHDTVCHFLKADEGSEDAITRVIRQANNAYFTVGILTCLKQDLEIRVGQEITLENLKHFAENSQCVFINAYDGESILIWSRNKIESSILI